MIQKMILEPDVRKTKALSSNTQVNKHTLLKKKDHKTPINRFLYSYPFRLRFRLKSIYKFVKQK